MDNTENRRFGPIPVKEGQEYDVEIEGIGEKGDGIAKVNGYVIVIPNVKKGDKVRVKVNAVRGKVSFGEVIGEAQGSEDKDEDADEEAEDKETEDEESDEDEATEDDGDFSDEEDK